MTEVKIVFETLYELLRREKYKNELQQLESTFYTDVIKYLTEKNSMLESQSKSNIFASAELQKTQKTVENAKKIIRELYDRRESKVIQLARIASMMGETTEFPEILPEERGIFKEIRETLVKYRKGVLDNVVMAKQPQIEEEKPKELKSDKKTGTKLVRFLSPTPKFIGEDLNVYGPYDEEDMAALPAKVAGVLIKKNRVELIK